MALIVALLSAGRITVIAQPQDQQHDMQNMPGMDMGKPKPTPTPQKKKKPASPPQKKDDMQGMDMKNMPSPTPSPTPSSSPVPTPAAPPQPMSNVMPGMQMPTATPTPAPSASPSASPEKMDMNMPMPSTSPSSDPSKSGSMGDMKDMKMSGHDHNSMPGMSGMKGMSGMMDMGSLMVMTEGDDMGIRVGSSGTNVMSMGQMGSGTAWQPASSPMYMYHKIAGDWLLMLHGEAKLGVNSQGGARGVTKFESMNWIMPMAYHKLGRGTLQLRGMFSLEPLTLAPGGTPELFQTGETYKGQPIIDKQHPHNLFMELSAQYTVAMGEHGTFFTYFGFPGEPALGPVAFMHRASAAENPSAPLTHHLQDSTHISFGVLTSGVTFRKFKLEGSVFNGREPGENRYHFEAHPFNSQSVRLSYAPNANWSMQMSYGHLVRPEVQELGDQNRLTASISYNKPFNRGNWASSLIWGRNHFYNGDFKGNANGYTAESTVNFLDKNYLYTRLELVDKNELLRASDRARLGITDDHASFRIGAYTAGYVRDVLQTNKLFVGIGTDLTFYSKPAILDTLYGKNPVSYKFFVRIRPRKMTMESMHTHSPGTVNANESTDHMGGDMKHPQE